MDAFKLVHQLRTFGATINSKIYKRGAWIAKVGDLQADVYFIIGGSVQVVCELQDEMQIIRLGYAGSVITALDTYLTQKPSQYAIQAIKQTEILVCSRSEMQRFWSSSIQSQSMWIAIVESLIVQQMEREIDLLYTDPKQRYERVLQRSAQLFQEVPHKYIANYLRMKPETLSRLKKS